MTIISPIVMAAYYISCWSTCLGRNCWTDLAEILHETRDCISDIECHMVGHWWHQPRGPGKGRQGGWPTKYHPRGPSRRRCLSLSLALTKLSSLLLCYNAFFITTHSKHAVKEFVKIYQASESYYMVLWTQEYEPMKTTIIDGGRFH